MGEFILIAAVVVGTVLLLALIISRANAAERADQKARDTQIMKDYEKQQSDMLDAYRKMVRDGILDGDNGGGSYQ